MTTTTASQRTLYLRFGLLTLLIFLAAFSRILPHMPNFSPLGAIGLFGAAHFSRRWQAFLVPLAATWLSDLVLNNVIYAEYYPGFVWFYEGFYWQYGSYLLITLTGILILNKVSVQRILAASLCSSILFFLVSNFGTWASGMIYPMTGEGLLACYIAGIPYIKGTFSGDLFYAAILFGTFALAQRQYPALRLKYA